MFEKTETDEERFIRYADIMIANSTIKGVLNKDCLDMYGIYQKEKLPLPLEKLRNELLELMPIINGNLDISNKYSQDNFDKIHKHLKDNDYLEPLDNTLEWQLNDIGKEVKRQKGHKKYIEYLDKKWRAEKAEMNGKIYWKTRVIVTAILAGIVGFFLRYLTEPKQQPPNRQVSAESRKSIIGLIPTVHISRTVIK